MYNLKFMFMALWPTFAMALFFVVVGVGLVSMAVHETHELENAPCEQFKNFRTKDVPARCTSFFQENK